jgi:hypothetical protein
MSKRTRAIILASMMAALNLAAMSAEVVPVPVEVVVAVPA